MVTYRLVLVALLAALLPPALHAQPVVVTGHVLGQDATPTKQAHVKLTTAGGDELDVRRAGDDGLYRLVLDTMGIYRMLVSGVDHRAKVVPLFVDGTADTVRLDVRLGRYVWRDNLSDARVIGGFNGFSTRRGERPLERQGDGTYAAFVAAEADTLAYQLVGVAAGVTDGINGPLANRYEYDYSGGYRSIVDVSDDHVRIVLRLSEREPAARPAVVSFADTSGSAARFAALADVLDRLGEAYDDGFRDQRRKGASPETMAKYTRQFDWSAGGRALREALDGADGQALRAALYAAYFTRVLRPDAALARQALLETPPSAMVWGAAPTALGRALEHAGDDVAEPYRQRALRQHGSADVRAFLLFKEVERAVRADDEAALRAAYAELSSTFPEHRYTNVARARYAPDRPMRVGSPVPSFAVTALDDSSTVYSDSTLAGQPVLIDFWATWCAPCIQEMPYLHEARERFGPGGLRILSLSFDRSPEVVRVFRGGQWPMPWLHAFVEDGFHSALADAFAIDGIPAPILVGPDGTIVATGMSLRGEALDETLEQHLGHRDEGGSE